MEKHLRCLLCEHEQCHDCLTDRKKAERWLTCCRCGFGAVASFWRGELCEAVTLVASGPRFCEYCGHLRCGDCQPDQWPLLADGCCNCIARVLRQALGEVC